MRRSNQANKTQVEKEVARRKYGERQVDKWVKWSFTMSCLLYTSDAADE